MKKRAVAGTITATPITNIMGEFLKLLLQGNAIIWQMFAAAIIASFSFGVVGSYVVARRISYIAAAIAHCVLGGLGAAFYCQQALGWEWCQPIFGAVLAAVAASLTIGWVSMHYKEREDTIISAIWAIGMAVGFLFLAKTPGYQQSLESFLFGNILYANSTDLWIMALLGLIVIACSVLFYNQLLAVCFDPEFARLRGVNVPLFFHLLLILVALSVVLLVQMAGILLAIALLVLPAATASHLTHKLWHGMVGAVILAMLYGTVGLSISYPIQLPPGPIIIIVAAVTYFAVLVSRKFMDARDADTEDSPAGTEPESG